MEPVISGDHGARIYMDLGIARYHETRQLLGDHLASLFIEAGRC